MEFSTYPISLGMLNLRLNSCQTLQDVNDNFAFAKSENKEENITFSIFVQSVEYLILSYKDLTFKNWGEFKKNIVRIFPNEQNCKALKHLENEVTLKFHSLYSQFDIIVESKQPETDLIEDAIKEITSIIEMSPQNRLSESFKFESAKGPLEKARVFQLILNFLILETDQMKIFSNYFKTVLEFIDSRKSVQEGCDRIIRLSRHLERTLYEIPAGIMESEEFSFWIQVCPYIDCSYDGEKLFASLKNFKVSETNLFELKERLKQIRKSTVNSRIHFLINKWFLCLDSYDLGINLRNSGVQMTQFLSKVTNTWIVQQKYSDELEFTSIPIGFYLYKLVNEHYMELALKTPQEFSQKKLHNFKRIINLWEISKSSQVKFFEFSFQQFQNLEKDNSKLKKSFLSYKKDLLGPYNKPCNKLCSYPTDYLIEATSKISSTSSMTISNPKTSQKKKKVQNVGREKIAAPSKKGEENFKGIHFQVEVDAEVKETKHNSILDSEEITKKTAELSSSLSNELPIKTEFVLPGQEPLFSFDQRVKRWDNHPFGEPLSEIEFPEYYDKGFEYQKLMHIFHAPHRLVDRFLSFGIEGEWLNVHKNKNDLRYVIPAEIIYGNIKYRGMIVYATDGVKKSCYHRYFTEMKDHDVLYQAVNKIFNENDYPELRDTVSLEGVSSNNLNLIDNSSVRFDLGGVVIDDHERGVMIKLFKCSI